MCSACDGKIHIGSLTAQVTNGRVPISEEATMWPHLDTVVVVAYYLELIEVTIGRYRGPSQMSFLPTIEKTLSSMYLLCL